MAPWFPWLTLALWVSVVAFAARVRGRQFATFAAVILGIHSLVAVAMAPAFARFAPLFAWLHLTVYINFLMLARPRMRSLPYRLLVSWPGSFFFAGTLLSLPWALARAAGWSPWGIYVPYALAALGFVQSMRARQEDIDLVIGGAPAGAPDPLPHPRGDAREPRPLRIVQISDPHIGPFMSVQRLRRIAQAAVAKRPDLVCLTGDFLTMESQGDPELLRRAFEPLAAMPGRVFACHGNHDLEAPATVRRALVANGIRLLVDEAEIVETEAGRVHVVGMDFVWRDREAHLRSVCAAHPRLPGTTRLVLLHDPGAFKHLPEGDADLVLSGHTHGGQVGLLSLGLSWTFLRLFGIKIPDHGFWARRRDRMYVHRGTGHYGFPLRIGVPAEDSVLHVHRQAPVA